MGPKRRGRSAVGAALATPAAWLALACASPDPISGPVVHERRLARAEGALRRVAVVPFHLRAAPIAGAAASAAPAPDLESAALLTSYFAEALARQGVDVVAPNDVALAFTGAGRPVPRQDGPAAAQLAAHEFGASAVALGQVYRYRERSGSGAGTLRPASVGFEVTLHEAPGGRTLWVGRFDETQKALSEAVFRARQYPGGGTRWLTAAELARWGAAEVARALTRDRK